MVEVMKYRLLHRLNVHALAFAFGKAQNTALSHRRPHARLSCFIVMALIHLLASSRTSCGVSADPRQGGSLKSGVDGFKALAASLNQDLISASTILGTRHVHTGDSRPVRSGYHIESVVMSVCLYVCMYVCMYVLYL